jgi:hypothetical protein
MHNGKAAAALQTVNVYPQGCNGELQSGIACASPNAACDVKNP